MTPPQSGVLSVGRRVLRGTIVIIFFGVFLKLGGLLLYYVLPWFFGTGRITDAFTAVYGTAFYLLLYSTALKVVLPAFMPIFSERMRQEDEVAAWRVVNTVLNLVLLSGIGLAVGVFAAAPYVVSVLFHRFDPETQQVCVLFLRWLVPGLPLYFFAMTAQGILNSYKVFSFPSAGEAAQKLTWVAGIFVLLLIAARSGRTESLGPHMVGAAFLVGCLVQSCILLWGLRLHLRLYRPTLPLFSAGRLQVEIGCVVAAAAVAGAACFALRGIPDTARRSFWMITAVLAAGCLYGVALWFRTRGKSPVLDRMICLAAPLVVGVLFARYRDIALAFFQTYTKEGGFTLIEMAKRVANMPNTLVAYPLGIALLPFLCDLAAQRDVNRMGKVVGGSVRMLAAALLPLTAVTLVMSGPVMQLLFDHGAAWNSEDVQRAALALAVLSTSILFIAIENVLMQTFFSLQRTVLPTVLGIIFSVLPGLALYVAIEHLHMEAHAFVLVCVAWPAAKILKNLFLLGFVQASVPLFTFRDSLAFCGKLAMLCLGPASAVWAAHRWVAGAIPLSDHATGRLEFELVKCVHVGVPSLCALAVFLALCILLRLEEFNVAVQWVREKGWRRRPEATQPGNPAD